ncbi:hypothetical protein K456DRAFT_153854 [Colletotrichum gloeosporioides 23]|nr:hypothetical protein K456DRAFT_153854 [Colletotrichum gloeosporioides 23]
MAALTEGLLGAAVRHGDRQTLRGGWGSMSLPAIYVGRGRRWRVGGGRAGGGEFQGVLSGGWLLLAHLLLCSWNLLLPGNLLIRISEKD